MPGRLDRRDDPVRVIDGFVDSIGLGERGLDGVVPEATDRPNLYPSVLLKLYIYGSLNRVSRVDGWSGRPDAASW
jgi:hypothetical protein